MIKKIVQIILILSPWVNVLAQRIGDVDLKFEGGLSLKSSSLPLTSLNEQLQGAGFSPFDSYTSEVDLFVNLTPGDYPFGISIGSAKGGSKNISPDESQYSNLRVNYLSIGVFYEFEYKRICARGYVMFEKGNYTGEFFKENLTGAPLSHLTGSIITNGAKGVKPYVQLLINLGKQKRNSIGAGWSYFFKLNETGWNFYPTGVSTNFPISGNGEQAFSITYLYRFYSQLKVNQTHSQKNRN